MADTSNNQGNKTFSFFFFTLGADHLTFGGGGGWVIYGQQDFFFLATRWVGYFFTAVQGFFSITFVLHAIFFFRQALAGNFFQNHPPPPSRVKWSAP